MKVIVRLTETNGEHEYTHICLLETTSHDIDLEGENIAKHYFGQEDEDIQELSEGVYWNESMERTISLFDIRELTEDEYNVLKRFL